MAEYMIGVQCFGGYSDDGVLTGPGARFMLQVPQTATLNDVAKAFAQKSGTNIDDVGLIASGEVVFAGFNVALGATELDEAWRDDDAIIIIIIIIIIRGSSSRGSIQHHGHRIVISRAQ